MGPRGGLLLRVLLRAEEDLAGPSAVPAGGDHAGPLHERGLVPGGRRGGTQGAGRLQPHMHVLLPQLPGGHAGESFSRILRANHAKSNSENNIGIS